MRVLSYKGGGSQLGGLIALIYDIYRERPQYAESRAGAVARMLAPSNPFFRHGDYQGFLACSGDRPMANACAIMDRRLPHVGLIGFFESQNEEDCAQSALKEAIKYLVSQGATTIRGPVDLTTWNGFRLSFSDAEPPFISEPFNPAYYRNFFRGSGFSVAQCNISTIHDVDEVGFDRFQVHYDKLNESGVVFERMQGKQLFDVLPQLHELAAECFSDTWSFVPIGFEEFQHTYADLAQVGGEVLVYTACGASGKPAGFCLGAFDWPCNGRRAVVKSIAVVPMKKRLEVARSLLYCLYRDATDRGVSEFILSTMRDDNQRVEALIPGRRPVYRQYEVYELDVRREGP